jgi:uncharacterized protein
MEDRIGPLAGPRAAFDAYRRRLLAGLGLPPESLAEDVVIEFPFAPEDRLGRFEGREGFLAFAQAARAELPVRFDEVCSVMIHETADPEVIVAEYEVRGTLRTTGERAGAHFVSVIRVHDGRVTLWREYQDVAAMTAALGPTRSGQAEG